MESLTDTKRSIRRGWEEVAVEYAKDRSGIFELGAKRLLEILLPSTDSSLLDVGCGTGAVALNAMEWVGSKGRVIGSDLAAAMVRLGQTTMTKEMTNIAFYQMDAERLGFANACFDNVTCAFSLFQFPDMDRALSEMWRVLKPKGCLGLSSWGPGYFSPIASLQRKLFREFGIRPLLTNPIVIEPDELKMMLHNAGFTSIETIEEASNFWFTSPEEVWAFNMDMGPFAVMLRQQLTKDKQSELLNRFKVMLGDLMTDQGIKSTFYLLYAVAKKGG